MDPDLVRQQAEAEQEYRTRAPVVAKSIPPKVESEKEIVSTAIKEHIAPQATVIAAMTDAAEKSGVSRWRVYVQALCSSTILAGFAGLAVAVWGMHHGFSADEQLRIGGEAAVLIAVIYGISLAVNGSGFTPAGRGR